ncbi:DUF805 domain-containing protein [Pseudomonas syringae]|nr:DUF805 domain-containing protein [Pseudomonas syringae]MBD8791162.1 DUF805 domain-containing protein [Pseudomonas syringae]MBD8802256.1 DUF805 domain-containing protein [Pseudomonas syringae]MBD8812919.1 DUF805 domain-containing protein [Pseudomonas syringae]
MANLFKNLRIRGALKQARTALLFCVHSCLGLLRLAMELRVEWLYPVWGEKRALEALLIVIAVPAFALMVRRLHDIGCSAWVSLAWLVPFSGAVLQVWMLLDKGDPEENYYGLPPCE